MDSDAEPLPDATVTPTVQGAASLPLLVERRDDGVLMLEVDPRERASGRPLRLRLPIPNGAPRPRLDQRRGSDAELRWQSPRFDQGIDTMRVVFRVPPMATAPSLPSYEDSDPAASFGAFIGNLRRAPDKDELEIVRPHVGQNEAVVWRAVVGSELGPSPEPSAAVQASSSTHKAPRSVPQPALDRLRAWGLLGMTALVYGFLVAWKWRGFARACSKSKARPRALLPLAVGLRAPLAGLSVAGAVGSTILLEKCDARRRLAPHRATRVRSLATRARSVTAAPAAGCLTEQGSVQQVSRAAPRRISGRFSARGVRRVCPRARRHRRRGRLAAPRSPHDALLAFVSASLLVPLFLTGRASDLPKGAAAAPERYSAPSRARSRSAPSLKVVPLGTPSEAKRRHRRAPALVRSRPLSTASSWSSSSRGRSRRR